MKCLVVIDTNVLVSALIGKSPDSPPVKVIERLLSGEIILVYSDAIIAEYSIVLRRRKFNLDYDLVDKLLDFIKRIGLCISPASSHAILSDIKDLPFYEVAMEKQKDGAYLITGNIKHFPKEPFIITPREFLELMK